MFQNELIQTRDVQSCYLCGGMGIDVIKGMPDRLFGVPGIWNYKRCVKCGLYWLTPWPQDLGQAYINYHTHRSAEDRRALTISPHSIKKRIAALAFGYPDKAASKKSAMYRMLALPGPLSDISGRSVMWLPGKHPGKLLDIGCGSGMFLEQMQELGWDAYGVEPDRNAAVIAKQTLAATEKIFAGPLEEAGFNNGQFDAITMAHVIEHLPDPVMILKECRRILQPNGRLVVTTPNVNSLGRKWFKKNWRGWEPPRHLFLFNAQALEKCALDAGFKNGQAKPHATTAFDIWLSGKKLQKGSSGKGFKASVFNFQALFFWLFEYSANKILPVGEELVLTAGPNS